MSAMRWSTADIADAVTEGLLHCARNDDLEQTVYGFDHRSELGLHPLIQQSLRGADFGVYVEQKYPSDWHKPKKSHGKRCDLVLTHKKEARGLRDPQVKGTLFDVTDLIDPQEAYWLEVKTVAQFETSGPFHRYTQELLSPVANDVKKIWGDSLICFGGLLLVLFTHSQTVADHDLGVWHCKCLEKGYPVAPPALRGFAITDRIGNGWCAVGVFGVRGA